MQSIRNEFTNTSFTALINRTSPGPQCTKVKHKKLIKTSHRIDETKGGLLPHPYKEEPSPHQFCS